MALYEQSFIQSPQPIVNNFACNLMSTIAMGLIAAMQAIDDPSHETPREAGRSSALAFARRG
jgi:hypothetical protein